MVDGFNGTGVWGDLLCRECRCRWWINPTAIAEADIEKPTGNILHGASELIGSEDHVSGVDIQPSVVSGDDPQVDHDEDDDADIVVTRLEEGVECADVD